MVGQVGNNTVNTQYNEVANANNFTPNAQTPPTQSAGEAQDTAYTISISPEALAHANSNTATNAPSTLRFHTSSVEGSFLLDFQHGTMNAENARNAYFWNLFRLSHDDVNAMMHTWANREPGGSSEVPGGWLANTVESSIARHAELRDEVHRAFGHDSELLAANLAALDRAFESNMQEIARSISDSARHESSLAESRAVFQAQVQKFGTGSEFLRHHETHALANHSSFNHREFERNTLNMMNQLTQFHLGQLNTGMNNNNAWQATMNFMSSMFGATTSVNSLSFNDFLLVQNSFGGNSPMMAGGVDAERNRLNSEFNNNTQLSPELRALLSA